MLLMAIRIETAERVSDHAARATAFRRLLETGLPRSYGIAANMLGDPIEAQDAVHDAAVAAWQRFGGLRDHDRFEPWFERILVNGCRDRLRARRRRPVVDIAVTPDEVLPWTPDHAAGVAAADAVERAVRALDPDHVAVVVLRYEADLTVPAIAERLGIAEGTVKSRLHHALRRMRASIGEEEDAR